MIRFRNVVPTCCLVAASAAAQTPPAPPAPPQAPAAVTAPTPPPSVNTHPKVYLEGWPDVDVNVNVDVDEIQRKVDSALSRIDFTEVNEQAQRAAALAVDQMNLQDMRMDAEFARDAARIAADAARGIDVQQLRAVADMARESVRNAVGWNGLAFAQQAPTPPVPPNAPTPAAAPRTFTFGPNNQIRISRNMSMDALYDRGQRALDNYTYDQALDAFTEVVNRGGVHADAALYWKAYTLNKLGRRDEATAALNELRTKYASSKWQDDAKALEIEVKQSSGQKVAPESQSDDDLKLLALNGLSQSDPDRALPILEKLLKSAQSPKVKRNAIYVLASNPSPKAQQMLEQIARGNANPDVQLQAILYIGRTGKQANRGQLLSEIYTSSQDQAVKRAVLSALVSAKEKDRLTQLAKNEKNPELKLDIIRDIGSSADQAEIWQMYQSESDPAVKAELVRLMSGNTQRLIDIAKTEKDAKLRRSAEQNLGNVKGANVSDALVSIYGTESDQSNKRVIVHALANQRTPQPLIQLWRKETDPELKRSILQSVVDMRSPETTQFLEEILNK